MGRLPLPQLRLAFLAVTVVGLGACDSADIDPAVTATVSAAIPTVATIQWPLVTPTASNAYVEFGTDDDHRRRAQAAIDDQGMARAVLLGMKPGREIHYHVVEVAGDRLLQGKDQKLDSGTLSSTLPRLDVPIATERGSRGFLVTSLLAEPSVAVIVDGDGEIVWAHRPDVDWDKLYIPRVRLSRVGEWVIYHAATAFGTDGEGGAETHRSFVRVALDGSSEEIISITDAHHDFIELGDGTIATLTRDRREVDGKEVVGDRILEAGWDGSERQVFSVWDHLEYDPAQDTGQSGFGWTHANALQYDKDAGLYFMSLRHLDCILAIDRATGTIQWTLGGQNSDYALADGSTQLFQRQHQFRMLDDHALVFDNGTVENQDSRVVEYALDAATGSADLVWEHHNDPPLLSIGMGDVERLPGGNTLVTWSGPGQVDEVSPTGEVVWRIRVEMGAAVGYTVWRQVLFPTMGLGLEGAGVRAAR